jgi:hypothetical protein
MITLKFSSLCLFYCTFQAEACTIRESGPSSVYADALCPALEAQVKQFSGYSIENS